MKDLLSNKTCSSCGEVIETGEYRVVVALSEFTSNEYGWPIRGYGFVIAFCDECIANMAKLEIPNRFEQIIEDRARWVSEASPRGLDALDGKRGVSGHGGNPEQRLTNGNDEEVGEADREANEFAAFRPPWQDSLPEVPLNIRSVGSVRRQTLRRYLSSPQSRGCMASTLRRVVRLYVDGDGQKEIARKIGKDQTTVSRMLQAALKLANAA
jgi:hypothetical protein